MYKFKNSIVTASAGTGKTYRLSVEFISLILNYYGSTDMQPDNILVLTFTRKATAEIRERIISHIDLLLISDHKLATDEQVKSKHSLITSIRKINPDPELPADELTPTEEGKLLSLRQIFAADKQQLRVMTIDAYINSIFRNLVRPLRSLDSFEIDLNTADKHLADILNSLMSPRIKNRIDKLLQRKIRPSLDQYKDFIISLIKRRWTYYLIKNRLLLDTQRSLQAYLVQDKSPDTFKDEFIRILGVIRSLILETQSRDNNNPWPDFFNKEFKQLFDKFPDNDPDLGRQLEKLALDNQKLYKLLTDISGSKLKNIYNGNKFRKKDDLETKEQMQQAQAELKSLIADWLVYSLIGVEQSEIIDIWGEVLAEYDKLIYRYRSMTYDDIAWFTFEALYSADPPIFNAMDEALASEFYQFLAHRNRFILIDEFQDTSLIQFSILQPIIEEVCSGLGTRSYGGVVVVGDEKQSIFGWRGGERELLLRLPAIIKPIGDVKTDVLDKSWRSSPHLMRYINGVFSAPQLHDYLAKRSMNWDYSPVESMKPNLDTQSELKLCIRGYSNRSANEDDIDYIQDTYRDFITRMILPEIQKNDGSSIAILCRRGKELSEMQLMLEGLGETGVFEPNADLTEHPLITPLIDWLRYLAFGDDFSLISFLRSDYILLKAAPIKEIIDYLSLEQENKQGPAAPMILTEIRKLADECRKHSIYDSCLKIVNEIYNPQNPSERDYLNIHAFLKIIREYELNHSAEGLSISTLLRYLQDNKAQEFMRQRTLNDQAPVQLLTIHKSKGLEFDKVFVFYNLSFRGKPDYNQIVSYIDYMGEDYKQLRDFAISLHYAKLIEESSFSYLAEADKRREMLEELNTLYVAFTRAVESLNIYFTFNSSDPWPDYYDAIAPDRLSLPALICNIGYEYMLTEGIAPDKGLFHTCSPSYNPTVSESSQKLKADSVIASYPVNLPYLSARPDYQERDQLPNLKQLWLEDRSALYGDLAHYYLSYLIRNTDIERLQGLKACIFRFGSILSKTAIEAICSQTDQFFAKQARLYEPAWDKIFTEKSIWSGNKEYRIDRMMVNTNEQMILLVDYKTGRIHELEQLDRYRSILMESPWIERNNYRIETEYIQFKLQL